MTDETFIGVDLGGTRIRAACLDDNLNLLERHETLTMASEGLDATLTRIKSMIHEAMPDDNSTVRGIGISAPGPLNPETGVVVAPPNLPGWHDVPLGDIIHEEFDLPVYVGNDANVAALAEMAHGAAQGYRHVIYITVSTGVGSGIIYDGRLLLGKTGLAGEAGHMIILAEDGRVSSVEKEAAGPALARHMRKHLQSGEESSIRDMVNNDLNAIDAEVIGKAANQGDPLAIRVVQYGGKIVGLGIVTLLHLFNPEVIVIGGGVSNIGKLLFDQIQQTVEKHALDDDYWKDLQIVPAGLAGNVSIIGAGALVLTGGGQADASKILTQLNRK